MAVKHGTRRRYIDGCRCDDCRASNTAYQQQRRARQANSTPAVVPLTPSVTPPTPPELGGVEKGVQQEIEGLAQAEARPALVQTALALARILDNPAARQQQAAAAKQLTEIMDKLHKGANARKSRLASVRQMTTPKQSAG